MQVFVFSVSSMSTDLSEFVYFDLTYTFDFIPLSSFANYVNMLRNSFTYMQMSFPFSGFFSFPFIH